uniref:Uncharacterized protein n=1 Tax=Kalanchoe fedtschenkoi TaxID=63787 RepID=A0A7N0VAM1_KALFE
MATCVAYGQKTKTKGNIHTRDQTDEMMLLDETIQKGRYSGQQCVTSLGQIMIFTATPSFRMLGLNPCKGSDSKMANLLPDWMFASDASRGSPVENSGSKEEENMPLTDNDTAEPAIWTPISTASESIGFSDIFQILSEIHLQETSAPLTAQTTDDIRTTMNSLGAFEHGEASNNTREKGVGELELRKCLSEGNEQYSSESERKEEQKQKPKRTRSAETHNMSERKDCASILDEAVEYLKALKVQAQMMSLGMGTVCYNPFMPITGMPNMPVAGYSPYIPFRPGMGLVPLVPVPSPTHSPPGILPLVQGPMDFRPSVPISGGFGLPSNTAMPSPPLLLDNKGKGLAFTGLETSSSGSQEASTSGQISSKSSPGSIVHATHIVPPAPDMPPPTN